MGAQVKTRPPAPADDAPADLRAVLNALRQIVRSLRVSSRLAEQQVGLSGAQLFVLQCLARQSPCSMNELAARTATDQSSVSVVVSRLVSRGHVRRIASKADRRRVELSLTRSGHALLETAPEAAQDRLLLALLALPKKDLGTLGRLLSRVVAGTDAGDQAPSLFFEDGPAKAPSKGRSRNV